jgi:hypothetical protein
MQATSSGEVGKADQRGETRAYRRIAVQVPIAVRRFGNQVWQYRGVCTDLSPAGLGAEVAAVFKVGEVLEVSLPEGDKQNCYAARVVFRNSGNHYGMCFLKA